MSAIEALIQDFVATFEKRDADLLAPFFHDEIFFANHGDPDVRGRDNVVQIWKRVFETFEEVRFETIHQAVNGQIVLAEQFHHLALPGRESVPVRNMAVYEVRDGQIILWRDYSDSKFARQQLDAAKPRQN